MAVKSGTGEGRLEGCGEGRDGVLVRRHDRGLRQALRPERGQFTIETSDGREFTVELTDTTNAQLVRNLGEPYADATGQMRDMLVPGATCSPTASSTRRAATTSTRPRPLTFPGARAHDYVFEKPDWWVKQI